MPSRVATLLSTSPRRAVALALLAGLILLVWRWDQLTSPPYWDYTIGLWREANFLVESGFDYRRLMYEEPSIWDGGTRTYGTSLLPGLLALLMLVSPSATFTLVVYHLLEIACAALVVGCVYLLLEPRAGSAIAVLMAWAAITVPLMSAQVDMVGMELPTTAIAILAAVVTLRGGYRIGALLGLLAFGFKATGALVTGALLVWLGTQTLLAWWIGEGDRARHTLRGVAWQSAALAIQVLITVWGGTVQALTVAEHRPTPLTLDNLLNTCPDVAGITVVGMAATLACWLLSLLRGVQERPWQPWGRSLLTWVEDHGCEIVSWMVVLGLWLAISRLIMIPRYLTLMVPFLACAIGGLAAASISWRRSIAVAGAIWLALNLFNQSGRLFPDLTDAYGGGLSRSGAILERSREYLADHQANRELVRLIDQEYGDRPIVAGFPFTLFLGLPRLGYVEQAKSGFSIQPASDTKTFRETAELLTALPRDPLFIKVGNSWYTQAAQFAVPEFDEIGEVIFNDQAKSPLIAIAQTWPNDTPDDQRFAWYLERMWPAASVTDQLQLQARVWRQRGDFDRAAELLREAIAEEPRDETIHLALARVLLDQERGDQAERAVQAALKLAPGSATCWATAAEIAAARGENEQAQERATRALALDPREPTALALCERVAASVDAPTAESP
jgi:tetratricopeptide (TPR) repeat protein